MCQQVVVECEGGAHIGSLSPILGDFHSSASLKTTRLLVRDDGLRPDADRLIAAIHAAGGTKVQDVHVATDHGWSDKRLTLQALVINWLAGL